MDNENAHSRLPGAGFWMMAMCLAPILYVLSIGPVVMVTEKLGVPPEPVRSFYIPVIWLHNTTPLKEPLEWYAALWGWQ